MLQKSAQRNRQSQQNPQTYQQGLTDGSVTAVAPFALPIHAEVGDEPVRILAAGNVVGMSPAYLVVDEQGDSQWVSLEETRIIDPSFKPIETRTRRTKQN